MREVLSITKAISCDTRIRILQFLAESELCLCQIIEILRMSPATVSKHLSILSGSGLVDARKEGRWRYYRLPDQPTLEVAAALEFLHRALAKSPVIKKDRGNVRKVLKMDKEELCIHYKGSA